MGTSWEGKPGKPSIEKGFEGLKARMKEAIDKFDVHGLVDIFEKSIFKLGADDNKIYLAAAALIEARCPLGKQSTDSRERRMSILAHELRDRVASMPRIRLSRGVASNREFLSELHRIYGTI